MALDDEKAFDIAVRLFEANIRAGQRNDWADLIPQVVDILPNLFDAIQRAWDECPKGSFDNVVDFKEGK